MLTKTEQTLVQMQLNFDLQVSTPAQQLAVETYIDGWFDDLDYPNVEEAVKDIKSCILDTHDTFAEFFEMYKVS